MSTTKKDDDLVRRMVEGTLLAAVANGYLDPTGKTDLELAYTFAKYLEQISDDSVKMVVTANHSIDLLKRARREKKNENYQIASLFYATWVEHWANWHARCLAVRHNVLASDQLKMMTREVNIKGKLGWLIPLLGGKPIAASHRGAIQRLCDHRNAFVHFKFPEAEVNEFEYSPPDLISAVQAFEKTVEYLQNRDRKVVSRGVREKIKKFSQQQLV